MMAVWSTVVVVTARDYELRAAFACVAPASPIRVGPLPAAVGYVDGTRLVGLVGGVGAIVAGVVASSASRSLIDDCAVIVSAGIAGAFAGAGDAWRRRRGHRSRGRGPRDAGQRWLRARVGPRLGVHHRMPTQVG